MYGRGEGGIDVTRRDDKKGTSLGARGTSGTNLMLVPFTPRLAYADRTMAEASNLGEWWVTTMHR
jgi:hypothetical protein